MEYKVIGQTFKSYDERIFNLEDSNGNRFTVDIFSEGGLECPEFDTPEQFEKWLSGMVGKTLEIEKIRPWIYLTEGKITVKE